MSFLLNVNDINELLEEVPKIFYPSNTYMNNIIGKYIDENKIKVLDETIMDNDEIIGEIQVIHLQYAISLYVTKNNKNVKELHEIIK